MYYNYKSNNNTIGRFLVFDFKVSDFKPKMLQIGKNHKERP